MIFESTIFGRDGGGFAWENVFHVAGSPDGGASTWDTLAALNTRIIDDIVPPYGLYMTDNAEILGVSSRGIYINSSPNRIEAIPTEGTRSLAAAVGGLSARLVWIPPDGSTQIGWMLVSGAAVGDFINDVLDPAVATLLSAIGAAFIGLNSSGANAFQLVIWNKLTTSARSVVDYYVSPNPTTLNKRQRA